MPKIISEIIPDAVNAATFDATNPNYNIWVSANAGSGKTHVLSQRVIRILLNKIEPHRILCLTYTKAAANEMKIRIFKQLSNWATMDDDALSVEIKNLEHIKPDKEKLEYARQLFAKVQDSPGGLKIQTIHSFCEMILHNFCIEAGVPLHFTTGDEYKESELRKKALLELIGDSEAQEDIDQLLVLLSIKQFDGIFEKIGRDISKFTEIIKSGYELPNWLKPKKSELEVIDEAWQLRPNFVNEIPSEKKGKKLTTLLESINKFNKPKYLADAYSFIKTCYLDSKNQVKKIETYVSDPLHKQKMLDLQERIKIWKTEYQLAELYKINQLIYDLAAKYVVILNRLKHDNSYLTFSDLIYKVRDLLEDKNFSGWVHYKLDKGIDHVLVDEAQDTSNLQWEIIQSLIEEFYVGEGQREYDRCCFAVGDEKQSIYSFQGAQPDAFSKNGRKVQELAKVVSKPFRERDLEYSFRSAPCILSAVDKVFSKTEELLEFMGGSIRHFAVKKDAEGYVELWDIFNKDEDNDNTQLSASRRLADSIGDRILDLVNKEAVELKDIIILVTNRTGEFCYDLLYSLKKRGIAVAGLDKFKLKNHIAIRDLCALGNFVLYQYDDLSLANLFKSPLFNLREEDLYNIATNYGQGRKYTLWQSLQNEAQRLDSLESISPEQQAICDMVESLHLYCKLANELPPFEFYNYILSKDGGRAKFLSRLGQEANEVLNEFLNLALRSKNSGGLSLHSFLSQIELSDIEIKRDIAMANEVRIMTVHGSKGLESDTVFIVDKKYNNNFSAEFLDEEGSFPVYCASTQYNDVDQIKDIIDKDKYKSEKERKRLLYVAVTRAKSKLIICGYNDGRPSDKLDWHSKIYDSIGDEWKKSDKPYKYDIYRYYYGGEPKQKSKHIAKVDNKVVTLPSYLHTPYVMPPAIPKPLTPSGTSAHIEKEDKFLKLPQKNLSLIRDSKQSKVTARQKGILFHKLLQYLPDMPEEAKESFLDITLKNFRPRLSASEIETIKLEVSTLMSNSNIKALFGKGSRSEVAIAGSILINGKQRMVSGQIDRVLIKEDEIIFADYKTGVAPHSFDDIPMEHIWQISLYYTLLKSYSKIPKPIRGLLIYTKTIQCFEITSKYMDEVLASYFERGA